METTTTLAPALTTWTSQDLEPTTTTVASQIVTTTANILSDPEGLNELSNAVSSAIDLVEEAFDLRDEEDERLQAAAEAEAAAAAESQKNSHEFNEKQYQDESVSAVVEVYQPPPTYFVRTRAIWRTLVPFGMFMTGALGIGPSMIAPFLGDETSLPAIFLTRAFTAPFRALFGMANAIHVGESLYAARLATSYGLDTPQVFRWWFQTLRYGIFSLWHLMYPSPDYVGLERMPVPTPDRDTKVALTVRRGDQEYLLAEIPNDQRRRKKR